VKSLRQPSREQLLRENGDLAARLREAEETLQAIREGEVDAIVVSGSGGDRIYSLGGEDEVYRRIVETMSEAAMTVSFDGKVLFANAQFALLLGVPAETIIGSRLVDLAAPADREALGAFLEASREGPAKTRISFTAAAAPVPLRLSGNLLVQPEEKNICVVASDLSELEASSIMVHSLRDQQVLLSGELVKRELLRRTASALLETVDPRSSMALLCREVLEVMECQLFIYYQADPGSRQLRLSAQEGLPAEDADRLAVVSQDTSFCGLVARDGKRMVVTTRGNTDDRLAHVRSLGMEAYACFPIIASGTVLGTLSFGTRSRAAFQENEISLLQTMTDQMAIALDRARAVGALRRANADLEGRVAARTAALDSSRRQLRRLAGELVLAEQRERHRLATILHDDLQQILAVARYQASSLAQDADEKLKPAAQGIENLLVLSLSLTHNLSSDLSPPIMRGAGLESAFKWLVKWMGERHGLGVTLDLSGEIPAAEENVVTLLFQSVRELLFNVVKHAKVNAAELAVSRDEEALRISVSDRGAGFDRSRLDAESGTLTFGIFSIMERMSLIGGFLDVASTPGKGSRFDLVIPLASLAPAAAERGGTEGAAEGHAPSIRVLVVDDHPVTREALVLMLRREKDIWVVGTAKDSPSALRLFDELCPDVVVMDVNLPGVDGIETTRAIVRRNPGARIIGFSMYEEESVTAAMREAGAFAYISKTAAPGILAEAIRGCCRDASDPAVRDPGAQPPS
jgi:PAS domain S-box-containing protein